MKKSSKRPGDRMWPSILPLVGILFVVAGWISQHTGIFWMCLFLSLICDTVSITTFIISALDDSLYRDVEDERRELQRQVESLQHENQRLEETNRRLEKRVTDMEEANIRQQRTIKILESKINRLYIPVSMIK